MRTKFICVSPISRKAKTIFEDSMLKFHSCRVKQDTDDKYLLESLNKSYYFWVDKKDDINWRIEQ